MHQLVLGQILLVTEIAAENLDGAVGEHFVHIHVRLRARTRLPDDEREIAVKLALKGLVRRLNDASARRSSNLPKARLASAQAPFRSANARTICTGIFSMPILKFS